MKYDHENDKIVSEVGSSIEIYPGGITFPSATYIEVNAGDESVDVQKENIRELIDGLTQAAARLGV